MAGSPQANMGAVWASMVRSYAESGGGAGETEYSNLGLNSFTDVKAPRSEYPKLKGRGAEIKHSAGPILATFKELGKAHASYTTIVSLLEALVDIHATLSEYSSDLFYHYLLLMD